MCKPGSQWRYVDAINLFIPKDKLLLFIDVHPLTGDGIFLLGEEIVKLPFEEVVAVDLLDDGTIRKKSDYR